MKTTCATALLALLTGCVSQEAACPPTTASAAATDWRTIATQDDIVRLRGWRDSWTSALTMARSTGSAAAIDAEGNLLDPDAALPLQQPEPGDYRCRTIKIGAQTDGVLNYVTYPWFECRITRDGGTLKFTKLNGSQRQIGRLLPQTDKRMVFLGTLQLGDENNTLAYGRDRERDTAGLLETIDDRRWRLVFPSPHFELLMDVMELVPKGNGPA